jgi:hypothetical protein
MLWVAQVDNTAWITTIEYCMMRDESVSKCSPLTRLEDAFSRCAPLRWLDHNVRYLLAGG